MPRSSLIVCPLGYDSNICYLPDSACHNYRFCQETAAAWPLPFYWDEIDFALVVTFSRVSVRECWNPIVIHHSIDGGSLVDSIVLGGFSSDLYEADYEQRSFSKSIKLIWEQLGWMPAVSNPNFPHHLNPGYDPIPF
jgi:hypothetical protein